MFCVYSFILIVKSWIIDLIIVFKRSKFCGKCWESFRKRISGIRALETLRTVNRAKKSAFSWVHQSNFIKSTLNISFSEGFLCSRFKIYKLPHPEGFSNSLQGAVTLLTTFSSHLVLFKCFNPPKSTAVRKKTASIKCTFWATNDLEHPPNAPQLRSRLNKFWSGIKKIIFSQEDTPQALYLLPLDRFGLFKGYAFQFDVFLEFYRLVQQVKISVWFLSSLG